MFAKVQANVIAYGLPPILTRLVIRLWVACTHLLLKVGRDGPLAHLMGMGAHNTTRGWVIRSVLIRRSYSRVAVVVRLLIG